MGICDGCVFDNRKKNKCNHHKGLQLDKDKCINYWDGNDGPDPTLTRMYASMCFISSIDPEDY